MDRIRVTFVRPLKPEEIKWPYTKGPETDEQVFDILPVNAGRVIEPPPEFFIARVVIEKV